MCVVILVVLNADVVLLLELEVLLPQGVDGVNHDLDQLDLGVAETVLVRDVIGVALIYNMSNMFLENVTYLSTHQSDHQTLPWSHVAGGEVPHSEQPAPWVPAWSSRAGQCGQRLAFLG